MLRNKFIWISLSFILILSILAKNFDFFAFSKSKSDSHQNFIIAKMPLQKGDRLTLQNTTVVSLDLSVASDQFVRNEEFDAFEGLIVRENINANLPLLKTNVLSSGTVGDNIPPGKRLFVLDMPVGPLVSILKPGDVVDIIAQIDMPSLGNVTETILEATNIVAIGNRSREDIAFDGENSFLSLHLTPDEVKIISFMKPYSHFSVVLRNPSDIAKSKHNAITFNHFLENEKIKKIIESDSFRIINGRTLK